MGTCHLVLFTIQIFAAFGQSLLSLKPALCIGKTDGLQCSSCDQLISCPTGASLKCEDLDKTRPYCNDFKPGQAVCQETSTCPVVGDPTVAAPKCKSLGRIPDPLNCAVYQQCSVLEKPAVQYSCPVGSSFDPKKEVCSTPAKLDLNCYTFRATDKAGLCRGKPLSVVFHPLRPDVYMICDGKYAPQMCESKDHSYDSKDNVCIFKCKTEGFFKDPSDVNKFITCVKGPKDWIQISQLCATGTKFNDGLKHCAAAPP